jgi:hypothetical protein
MMIPKVAWIDTVANTYQEFPQLEVHEPGGTGHKTPHMISQQDMKLTSAFLLYGS